MKRKTILLLLIIPIIAILGYQLWIFNSQPLWRKKKIYSKTLIPPELLKGDTLYLGDDFNKVCQIDSLTQFWVQDGLSKGRNYIEGDYWGVNLFHHARFNSDNKLVTLSFEVRNLDTLPVNSFFSKIGKIMIHYYGKNFRIHNFDSDSAVRVLYWELPDNNSIYMYGHINKSDVTPENDNNLFIFFDSFTSIHYPLNTKDTRRDLGLE